MTRARLIALLLVLACSGALDASTMPVPVTVQLPLFTKIWKLDRAFPISGEIVVAILYQESHGPSAIVKSQVETWIASSGQRIRSIALAIDQWPSAINTVPSVIGTTRIVVIHRW